MGLAVINPHGQVRTCSVPPSSVCLWCPPTNINFFLVSFLGFRRLFESMRDYRLASNKIAMCVAIGAVLALARLPTTLQMLRPALPPFVPQTLCCSHLTQVC